MSTGGTTTEAAKRPASMPKLESVIVALGNTGATFRVPSNLTCAAIDQLINYGEVQRGRLGLIGQDLTPYLAEAFDLDRARGAIFTRVQAGSPAEDAGLEPGDVIVEVNGTKIESTVHLRRVVGLVEPGGPLEIRIYRRGLERSVAATLRWKQQAEPSGERRHGGSPEL